MRALPIIRKRTRRYLSGGNSAVDREMVMKSKTKSCQRYHTRTIANLLMELEDAEDARDSKMKSMLQKVCQRITAE